MDAERPPDHEYGLRIEAAATETETARGLLRGAQEGLSARGQRAVSPRCAISRCGCCSASSTCMAWLGWDGRQAVLFDLPARKFYVFGLTFWPQDFIFLALLLIIAALSAVLLHRARPAACGAATPARRRSGPRSSCGWSAGPKATARAHETRCRRPGRARNGCARRLQARALDHLRAVDRLHLRRLLHPDPRPRREASCPSTRVAGRRSGCCSTALPPGATPACCANRCASTCARTRASRARCSTATP
jgi:hypothetical protein